MTWETCRSFTGRVATAGDGSTSGACETCGIDFNVHPQPLELDVANQFGVGARGNHVVFAMFPNRALTPTEALVFAAWVVSVAETLQHIHGGKEAPLFEEILKAVHNT